MGGSLALTSWKPLLWHVVTQKTCWNMLTSAKMDMFTAPARTQSVARSLSHLEHLKVPTFLNLSGSYMPLDRCPKGCVLSGTFQIECFTFPGSTLRFQFPLFPHPSANALCLEPLTFHCWNLASTSGLNPPGILFFLTLGRPPGS